MDEVPLLRESKVYVDRLCVAAKKYSDSRYKHARRVNWSHKYSESYYQSECRLFLANPTNYLSSSVGKMSELPDIFEQKINIKGVLRIFIKVLLHKTFCAIGKLQRLFWSRRKSCVYRKAYVDDIELVYDDDVMADRYVYPFPISASRQIKYIRWLLSMKRRFCLAGHSYLIRDLLQFIIKRDMHTLVRLERRAQILHAKEIVGQGYEKIELSDEYDLGSLEFCRMLSRSRVEIKNGAHGIGKYLPFHRYHIFSVITRRQRDYYRAIFSCEYIFTELNLKSHFLAKQSMQGSKSIIFIGQIIPGSGTIMIDAEKELLTLLEAEFGRDNGVSLFYRPHPNLLEVKLSNKFKISSDFLDYGPEANRIFLTFFSTSHIDPNFKGRSYLIRTRNIRPEISFDDESEILELSSLVPKLREVLKLSE